MKKITIFMFSLLFALSVPLLAAAHDMDHTMGHHMGPEMHAKAGCCGDHSSSGMNRMGMGREEGMRGGFGMRGAVMSEMPWFYLRHSRDLKLSDGQVASLKKISFELRKDMITKGADVKVRRLELAEILSRPDYKLDDATAKLKEVEDARLALVTAMLQHAVQARDVLTPAQLKGLKDIRMHDGCGKPCGKGMKRPMFEKGK